MTGFHHHFANEIGFETFVLHVLFPPAGIWANACLAPIVSGTITVVVFCMTSLLYLLGGARSLIGKGLGCDRRNYRDTQ
jgi:hypothetical protein